MSTRDQTGLFGKSWFCPQLESSVIPRNRGIAIWTTPSGSVIPLTSDPKLPSELRSANGEWRARVLAARVVISNEDGWKFSYRQGKLDAVESPTGRMLEFVRDNGKLLGLCLSDSASGQKQALLSLTYLEGGRRVSTLNANGCLVRLTYEKDGASDRLMAWQPEFGMASRFSYDSHSGALAIQRIDRGGKFEDLRFLTEYIPPETPADDTPQRRRDPAAYRIVDDAKNTYVYSKGNTISMTPKDGGGAITGTYEAKRGSIVSGDSDGGERRMIYYRAPGRRYDGRLRRIEQNGRVVQEFRYSRRTGRLQESVDENGVITFYDYAQGAGNRWEPKPIRVRQGTRKNNHIVAEYAYDASGRVLASKDASGKVTRFTYSPRGDLIAVSDSTGAQIKIARDALGRVIAVDRNGAVDKVDYNKEGRMARRVDPAGVVTEFEYDATGQISEVRKGGRPSTTIRRDAAGRVTEQTDALGRTRKFDYDEQGNLIADHAANGATTHYEYDLRNRRTAQIDGNGNRVSFEYDASGHLIKQTNAEGKILTWTYENGKLVERTNGVQTIRHTYDSANRLARIQYVDADAAAPAENAAPASATAGAGQKSNAAQTIDYAYDSAGRMLSATTPETRFEYLRDAAGKVEAMRCILGEQEQLVRYRYDAAGRRTGLLLAEFRPVVPSTGGRIGREASYEVLQQTEYTYDAAGRLASILDQGKEIVRYEYDAAGRLSRKTFGNGMQAEISYDTSGRLGRTVFSGGSLPGPKALTYTWDEASQVAKREWNGVVQRYGYDPAGQLLEVVDDATGAKLETYVYDKAGNMLEKVIGGEATTMTYNAANELCTRTVTSTGSAPRSQKYAYDAAGRLLGYQGGGQSRYGWLDKLTALQLPDGTQVTYTYWPDGQLAEKKVEPPNRGLLQVSNRALSSEEQGRGVETFLWDGLALLRRNDTVYIIEPHPSGGVPIASHPVGNANEVTYYLNDMLGTTLATVKGASVAYVKLTSFGQLRADTNATSSDLDSQVNSPSNPDSEPNYLKNINLTR